MKLIRATSTAGIFLLFGTMVPVSAQRDGDKGKSDGRAPGGPQRSDQPRQQQKQGQQQQRVQRPPQQQPTQPAQDPQRQQRKQAQQPQKQQQPQRAQQPQRSQPERSQQQARSWQQQRGWDQRGAWQGHNTWQGNRARNWSSEHRTWAQRGGYGGYYIPRNQFSLYFGPRHYFRLQARPVIYMGYPRFYYGGFSFLLLDPWPEYWAPNWYDADDLYIDYDDYDGGYYLYHRRDPRVRLAVTVLL